MEVGGDLTVETSNVSLGPALYPEDPPAGDYVAICVADTGAGMTDEIRAKVFEPFFTTKEIGKGSGLGLSQVLGFAKQSGGGVRVDSKVGRGTSIHIYLPRAQGVADAAEPATATERASATTKGTLILLVDDDQSVRDITSSLLKDMGYSVVEAGSGGAALDLLEREPDIKLMLVDFAMPGMNGAEVARQAYAKRPHLPILFVTGFADRAAMEGVSEAYIVGKPFMSNELSSKVNAVLASGTRGNVVRLRR
jgi:CheY-like chemotaxis protein